MEGRENLSSWYQSNLASDYEIEDRKQEWATGKAINPWDTFGRQGAVDAAVQLLKEAGISAPKSGSGWAALVNTLEEAGVELEREGEALQFFRNYDGPQDPSLRAAAEIRKGQPRRTLGDLIEAHRADKEAGWSPSTVNAYKPVHRLLKDSLGTTRALESINRDAARDVFELIKSLPKNIGKRADMNGLTVPDAVKRGKLLGLPTISAKTINGTYLSGIKAMFEWAEAEDWIDKNPFRKISVSDPVPDVERRDTFTLDQLQTLFGSAPWTPRDASPSGKPAFYWVPLLALFHGLRLG